MNTKALIALLNDWESKRATVSVEDFAKSQKKKDTTEKKEPAQKSDKKPSEYQLFLKKWREDNPTVKGKDAIKQGAEAWNVSKNTTK